ncbi:unnamed protein product [Brachionus calyciflorus]|uniref:Vasohibin 1 n=1 Tax=Brachionus calyciflorus TaxID=104777 RepID=A0A813P9Y3_9BILA|nr:unnamed protein product [Brachionus calyciflorus]
MSTSNFVPVKEGNKIIFYLNTGGFPLSNDVLSQMWTYAKELQPTAAEKINQIQNNKEKLADAEVPIPPYVQLNNKSYTNANKLERIQEYIDKLQYNHTGLQFFEIRKDRPLMGLAELSKKMIEHSLPIKCLEAVILSIYFINEITPANPLSGVEKFTIGFKTSSKGNIHRHVVLGVYCHSSGLFGALGISRRNDLGYKNLQFESLSDLIQDYIECYSNYLHKVKRIKIGLPIPNSNRSIESIPWNGCTINLNENKDWSKLVEKHSRSIRHFNSIYNSKPLQNSKTNSNRTLSLNLSKNSSYLGKHLNKVNFSKSNLKLEKNALKNLIEDDVDVYDEEDEDYLFEKEIVSTSLNKLNQDETSHESITIISNLRKSSSMYRHVNSVHDDYSIDLIKRKPTSLRI